MRAIAGLNPAGNPPLAAKAVNRQPSKDYFEWTKTPAGSRVPMVLNYSCCVVLGSGLAWLGTA